MKLADKLFELRKEKGWSQEKLAERQCYCGCVFGAQDQGLIYEINLDKSMSLARAFPSGSLVKHCQNSKKL